VVVELKEELRATQFLLLLSNFIIALGRTDPGLLQKRQNYKITLSLISYLITSGSRSHSRRILLEAQVLVTLRTRL